MKRKGNRKKIFNIVELVIIFTICISNVTFSQKKNNTTAIPSGYARFESLGYNPYILDAAVDINRNPAWGGIYENYLFGDIGKYSNNNDIKDSAYKLNDQYAGANFKLGRQWDLGVILNRPEGQLYTGIMSKELLKYGLNQPNFPIEVLVTYTTAKTIISLSPYWAGWSAKYSDNSYSYDKSTSVYGGTLGFIFKSSNPASFSEASVSLRQNNYSASIDSTIGDGKTTVTHLIADNNGGLELNANYKGWYRMKNSNVTMVPFVGFRLFSYDPILFSSGVSSSKQLDDKFWSVEAGLGVNFPIADHGFFAGGLSGGYTSEDFKTTDTIAHPPVETKKTNVILPAINLGIEWNLTDWLQGRFGYSKSIISEDNTGTVTAPDGSSVTGTFKGSHSSNPDQTITVGLGWQFDRFSLDGLIGEQLFTTGPNIISGKQSDLYGRLSVSYNFLK